MNVSRGETNQAIRKGCSTQQTHMKRNRTKFWIRHARLEVKRQPPVKNSSRLQTDSVRNPAAGRVCRLIPSSSGRYAVGRSLLRKTDRNLRRFDETQMVRRHMRRRDYNRPQLCFTRGSEWPSFTHRQTGSAPHPSEGRRHEKSPGLDQARYKWHV